MSAGPWPVDLDGDGRLDVFGVTSGCAAADEDHRSRLFVFSADHPPGDPYPDAWMDWVWEDGRSESSSRYFLHWDGDQPGLILTDPSWDEWQWQWYYEPTAPTDYDFYALAPGEREIGDDGDLALEPGWTYYPTRQDSEPRLDLAMSLYDEDDAVVSSGWCPSGDLCRSGLLDYPALPPGLESKGYRDITGDGLSDAMVLLDGGVDGVVDASTWELFYRDGDGYLPFEPPITLTRAETWQGTAEVLSISVVPDLTGDGVPELQLWELPVEPETLSRRDKIFFSHSLQSGDPRALAHTTFTPRYPEGDEIAFDYDGTAGAVADFDADGDNDLALLIYNVQIGWRVSVFRGPLAGALTEDDADRVSVLHPVGACDGFYSDISAADTDGDGAAELFIDLSCRPLKAFYLPGAGL